MSSSTPGPKFLLDENVRIELAKLLDSQGLDFKPAPKGSTDKLLASASKKEKRVLVTNDEDFALYPKDKIFSVVWLRIPQDKPNELISSFSKLLKDLNDFSGKLVVLSSGKWEEFPLIREVEV